MTTLTHGHTSRKGGRSKTYRTWQSMLQRCLNSSSISYRHYGGRGITVCERWLNFVNFLADMGEKPEGMTLDRIDNNGDYEPGNCRWTTRHQQARNYSRNKMITFHGETLCMKDWAAKVGVSQPQMFNRFRNGWSVERALTTPADQRYNRYRRLNGQA